MCGIFTVLDIKGDPVELRKQAIAHVKRLRHRGPDWSGVYSDNRAVICHERLAIVDVTHGAQPLSTGRPVASSPSTARFTTTRSFGPRA